MKKSKILGINPNTGNLIYREDVDKITGSISTGHSAAITPTLRDPIRKVNANNWNNDEVTISDLQDQLATLEARRLAAYETGSYTMARQIEEGIARLQFMLKTRTDGDLTLI